MNNPVLSEKAFKRSGETSVATPDVMTVNGTFARAGVLLAIMLTGAVVGWARVSPLGHGRILVPGWTWVALAGAFVLALVCSFRPRTAPFLSPAYALLEGLFLGVISHAFDLRGSGIALLAVLATAAAFAVTLALYVLGVVQVTEKFIAVVISATIAVALLYVVALLCSVLGFDMLFLTRTGASGIVISAVIVVIAALNLFVDYEFIRESAAAGAPKHMEWYGAFGLMLTLVWLYLEILRLLAEAAGDD